MELARTFQDDRNTNTFYCNTWSIWRSTKMNFRGRLLLFFRQQRWRISVRNEKARWKFPSWRPSNMIWVSETRNEMKASIGFNSDQYGSVQLARNSWLLVKWTSFRNALVLSSQATWSFHTDWESEVSSLFRHRCSKTTNRSRLRQAVQGLVCASFSTW